MTSSFGELLLIANPRAGRGRSAVLPELEAALATHGLTHRTVLTSGPGDATKVARQAAENGTRLIVAVGGDGTVHEVVNGLVDPETGERIGEAVLGLAPAGSGCDFSRTFGLDRDPETIARHLAGDTLYPIDVGRVRCVGFDGQPVTRLFANIAEAGYGGYVTNLANGLPRFLGPARYAVGMMAAVAKFKLVEGSVTIDHTQINEPMSNVVVANAQFFGGGMHVAPRAVPDDGKFNVQIFKGEMKDVITMAPKLRSGDHTSDPDVREYQSAKVEFTTDRPVILEADGEVLGTTPATFDIFQKALQLKI